MIKLFPSQYFFDKETEQKYIEWLFQKTRIFVIAIAILVIALVTAITIANIYYTGFEIVKSTVLYVRIIVWLICLAIIVSFIWLKSNTARKVLFATTIVLTAMAFADTYYWVGNVGYFTPEAQMITMFMFMIVPFLNVEHKVVSGFLIILGLTICKYIHQSDVFWSMFYTIIMYITNIVVYYKFDILLRVQFKTICHEQKRSNTDTLTGLCNKNALYTFFINDLKSLKPTEIMVVGVLDIDCFKNYNDTYGHIEGDKVLKKIAQTLLCFDFDNVYRFGGEEFIFTITKNAQITSKLPNICLVLESLHIDHKSSIVSQFVTASLGITTVKRESLKISLSDEELINTVIHAADTNLYQAKNSGRNQAITSPYTLTI